MTRRLLALAGMLLLVGITATSDGANSAISALAPVDVLADGFKALRGIVVDPAGNVFVADRSSGSVTKIMLDHSQTVIVSGLKHPTGLTLDSSGRVLIAETGANRVVRVESNGALTTLASGNFQPRWLALRDDGTLFIAARPATSEPDQETDDGTPPDVILALSPAGQLSSFSTGFANLQGLAVNHTALVAATQGLGSAVVAGVIFQIAIYPDGSAGTPVAIGPTTAFTQPVGLARDNLGAMFLSVQQLKATNTNRAIAKLRPAGDVTLFASGFSDPQGLAFDAQSNLYLTDDARILRFRAPAPPALSALPVFTNQPAVTVSGTTEAGARVDVFVNDATTPITVSADSAGGFSVQVALASSAANTLEVFATGHGGDGLASPPATATVTRDAGAPALVFQAPPAGAFVRQTVTVQARATDTGSGVATLTLTVDGQPLTASVAPALPGSSATATASWNTAGTSDGSHTLGATAVDRAGNIASATRVVIVDNTAPDTQIVSGPSGEIGTTTTTFTFAGSDNLTAPAALLFAWRLDGGAFTSPSPATSATATGLAEGAHTFDVVAQDLAGNVDATPASRSFSVRRGPSIASLDPGSGSIGTLVTITGAGFEPGTTSVSFNGAAAAVRTVTATAMTTTVPIQATTGPVAVTTTRGTASAAFTVSRPDFTITAAPASVPVVPGTSVNIAVSTLTTTQSVDVITLATGPLPAGVTASFSPPVATAGTSSVLTLTTSATTPIGPSAIDIRATALVDGLTVTRTATTTLAVQPPGQTTLIGEVRDRSDRPLAGVRILLGGTTLTPLGESDAGGNFFVPLSISGTRVMLLDGSPLNTADAYWPTVPLTVTITAGVVNTIGFTPRLEAIPVAKLIPIVPGQDTVLTDPDIPGFRMTIPAGVSIIGWDGHANTQVGVVSIPVDRSPLPPLPAGITATRTYLFSFGKLGGGVPTGPVVIDTPNDLGALPGHQVDLYYFNEAPDGTAPNRWEKYGTATVSADGESLITDVNPATGVRYGMPRFCCGGMNPSAPPTASAGGGPSGGSVDAGRSVGEPVDAATGFFSATKTDLALSGIIPIAVTRTYRTNLTNAGPFGLGTSWEWDVFLVAAGPPGNPASALLLVTPGNRQDLFSFTANGYANGTAPALRGATIVGESLGPGPLGRLFTVRFKDGRQWRFDFNGRLVSQQDRLGNTVTVSRDSQLRVTAVTEPSGRQLTFTYEGTNLRISSARDPLGRVVQYTYDSVGHLTTVTDPAGGVTAYTYDANHRMLTITDPRGITYVTNEYDGDGRVSRQTQADGTVWTYAYTATGAYISETAVTDPLGHATRYRFNAAGYPVSETDALGQTTTFTREPRTNLLIATSDQIGRVTRYTYDPQANVISITDPAGNVWNFTYEPTFNKPASVKDPLGNINAFAYDAVGDLTTITNPLGKHTTIAYNGAGQPTRSTDPLGHTTTFAYDANGNLVTVADPLGNTTARQYDAASRLIRQLDQQSRPTSFRYDALNRLTGVIDPLGGVTAFNYDGTGNLLTVTDARGNSTTHAYDTMGRLATRTDPVGATESYRYDGSGNPVEHLDRSGKVATFSYDPLNRRVGALYADATVSLAYDAVGRLILASDTAGGTVENRYDLLDRLTEQTQALGTISYQYDALGRRTQMQAPGAAPVFYAYDTASRLTSMSQAPLAPVTLEYDAGGRRTKLMLPNQVSTEYQYDAASRISSLIYRNAAGQLGDLTYEYDAGGNRTSVGGSFARTLLPDAVTTASYDAANRQALFGTKQVTFDSNGNVAAILDSGVTTTFAWDARDRLVQVATASSTVSFQYDADGRRMAKTIDGRTTQFGYDQLDPVIETADSALSTRLNGLVIDTPLIRNDEFYLTDLLGSVVALTDTAGQAVTRYTYEPYGRTQADGIPSTNGHQFVARENDEVSGLYHYRMRYYSTALHRFLSEDPLRLLGGVNGYLYARSNPILFTDPLGLRDAIVVLYQGQGGNPLNHIGIGLDNPYFRTTGFNPYPNALLEGASLFGIITVPGFAGLDTTPPLEIVRIPLSPVQEDAVRKAITDRVGSPGWYKLVTNNCAHFVEHVLRAAGIQVPNTRYPNYLMKHLKSIYVEPGF